MDIKTEWLVRQRGRVGRTQLLDAKMTKKGDVVAVFESPKNWSEHELQNRKWVTIHTDMEITDAMAYVEREPGFYEERPLLKQRAKHLDFEALMEALRIRRPEQADNIDRPNRDRPFRISKEVLSEFTRVKPRAPRRND